MSDQQQLQTAFFDPNGSNPHLPPAPSDDEIRMALAHNNKHCALNRVFVSQANEGNMRILRRFAFTAYKRYNRSCRGCNFGIFSPPGQGKTFIAKAWAETIGIPFVFVQSPSLDSTYMLFELISEECKKFGTPVTPLKHKNSDFTLPPCIVFFDEAHAIKDSLMTGGLLNAMEPDDAYMVIKQGRSEAKVVDCKDVCWIGATTELGDLFDAFVSRLLTTIEWVPASPTELPLIVKAGLENKADKGELPFAPDLEVCKLIAKYQSSPRLAIHGFGTKVVQQKDMFPSNTWQEACGVIARDMGLNDFGLDQKQMLVLTALGQRPIAEARLADVAKCRVPQIKRFVMPGLMQYMNDGPYVVSLSGRGMCITKSGEKLLDRMGIQHNGEKVTAEHFESQR